MKLPCEVHVSNRGIQNPSWGYWLPKSSKMLHIKSTLSICRQPKAKIEFCMILFTAKIKNGTKYDISENISKIITKFIAEGKATIQFKEPAHDLFIKADAMRLKNFLHVLKCALLRKDVDKLPFETLGTQPLSTKVLQVQKKLTILSRSELPLRGFPCTLESLVIINIGLCTFPKGILKLKQLQTLDLRHNNIEKIPYDICEMRLVELNISHNKLHKARPCEWSWIASPGLSTSLLSLNLSNNELQFLPDNIHMLEVLQNLNVSNNKLTLLPSGIGILQNIKVFNISNNNLKILPGSISKWKYRLDDIDVSCNNFQNIDNVPVIPKTFQVCSLLEYSAKQVLISRVHYTSETLPEILIRFVGTAKFCGCGIPCFKSYYESFGNMQISNIAKNFTASNFSDRLLPITCHSCSLQCHQTYTSTRQRLHGIVR